MTKAKKRARRQKSERTSQAGETMVSHILKLWRQFNWKPNKYGYAVGKNVVIASALLAAAYLSLSFFNRPTRPFNSPSVDKAHLDRPPPKKTKQATVDQEQTKKSRNDASQRLPDGMTALISDNGVLVRESPKLNAKVLDRAIFGTSVDVVELDGKWVKIHSSAQNLDGWTEKSRLNF
jgi:hypothetical protein